MPAAAGEPGSEGRDCQPEAEFRAGNLFAGATPPRGAEIFDTLFHRVGMRIERIASNRHATPEGFWYDQPEHEWVMVARGEALLAFADGSRRALSTGDWVLIPPHCRHRVEVTGADTVWLAIHAGGENRFE